MSTDNSSFYSILVSRILLLLQEREGDMKALDEEQVCTYATNARALQTRCTLENVLTKRFDDIIIPIFAEILAVIDRYLNLNLLDPKNLPEDDKKALEALWLAVFSSTHILKLGWLEMAPRVGTEETVSSAEIKVHLAHDFQCQFPFFWIFMETIDSLWDEARSELGLYFYI